MDYRNAFAISALGMNVERTRVEVATLNLANANTVQAAGTPGYQPMRVVAMAQPAGAGVPGTTAVSDSTASFGAMVHAGVAKVIHGLGPAFQVVPSHAGPRMVHEPGHPLANEQGFVAYPGVDMANEMVTLMSATRAYEANVAAMNTSRALALKALEIGGAA